MTQLERCEFCQSTELEIGYFAQKNIEFPIVICFHRTIAER